MHNENGGSRFLEGLVFGGLIGLGLGMLFAPLSGEKTRKKLMEKLKELDLDDALSRFGEAFDAGLSEAEKEIKE